MTISVHDELLNAVVLAPGRYRTPNGKTAHGLVRGSDRFRVQTVVDPSCAGRDAGVVLDGVNRGIPIVESLEEALRFTPKPTHCIVGVATHGGKFTPELRLALLEAVRAGLTVVNGLHDSAVDDPDIAAAALQQGVPLIDLRRPKPKHELHFWTGAIYQVKAPRIAVLGMDCAIGKRTTTRMLVQTLNRFGIKAEMIYTGQTGWMQGGRYGFVLDATLNDYVSGELEHAIVTCEHDIQPDIMVIEGQSALRNPSGPCGAELILSAATKNVILQHAPGRLYFEGYEKQHLRIPALAEEIQLIKYYGATVLAVTLHNEHLTFEALRTTQQQLQTQLSLPVLCPLEDGLDELVPLVKNLITEANRA